MDATARGVPHPGAPAERPSCAPARPTPPELLRRCLGELTARRVHRRQQLLLLHLLAHAERDRGYTCAVSLRALARASGVALTSLVAAVGEMREAGLLEVLEGSERVAAGRRYRPAGLASAWGECDAEQLEATRALLRFHLEHCAAAGLGEIPRLVLLGLSLFANKREGWRAWPSERTLASVVRVSPRSIASALRALENAGLVFSAYVRREVRRPGSRRGVTRGVRTYQLVQLARHDRVRRGASPATSGRARPRVAGTPGGVSNRAAKVSREVLPKREAPSAARTPVSPTPAAVDEIRAWAASLAARFGAAPPVPAPSRAPSPERPVPEPRAATASTTAPPPPESRPPLAGASHATVCHEPSHADAKSSAATLPANLLVGMNAPSRALMPPRGPDSPARATEELHAFVPLHLLRRRPARRARAPPARSPRAVRADDRR